ncbi:hypothetical protein G7Y89_g8559 [Cudoniella acicularis]|uniref:Uncharacterized protein n=1 Tax=Cudoniella acicularis TaxID=354080 RepID=A0A8H4W2R8_9HELO|nr:hypothetical protein G7Y89_g8559 [Cudoniella acicularis]
MRFRRERNHVKLYYLSRRSQPRVYPSLTVHNKTTTAREKKTAPKIPPDQSRTLIPSVAQDLVADAEGEVVLTDIFDDVAVAVPDAGSKVVSETTDAALPLAFWQTDGMVVDAPEMKFTAAHSTVYQHLTTSLSGVMPADLAAGALIPGSQKAPRPYSAIIGNTTVQLPEAVGSSVARELNSRYRN